jgi:hypothetical protein
VGWGGELELSVVTCDNWISSNSQPGALAKKRAYMSETETFSKLSYLPEKQLDLSRLVLKQGGKTLKFYGRPVECNPELLELLNVWSAPPHPAHSLASWREGLLSSSKTTQFLSFS